MKAESSHPEGIKRHCLSVHGWLYKSQCPPGAESGMGYEGQKGQVTKGILGKT